jgi:hypothetical protein
MRQGVQTLLAELGEAACLALCICELGKPGLSEGDAVDLIRRAIDLGYIDYDEKDRSNPNNCCVRNRDAFMDMVSGQRGWKSTKEGPGYTARPGEKLIECWSWNETTDGKVIAHQHFRLPGWDPIIEARTVRYGHLESYRVFRRGA